MTGDSKEGKGPEKDLLSELLDLGEDDRTQILEPEQQSFVAKTPVENIPPKKPAATSALDELLEDHTEFAPQETDINESTEFVSKTDVGKSSLDDLLGAENRTSRVIEPPPSSKSAEQRLEDVSFIGDAFDATAADTPELEEPIDALDKTLFDQPAQAEASPDRTIMLEKPETSVEEDPIDLALNDYVKENSGEQKSLLGDVDSPSESVSSSAAADSLDENSSLLPNEEVKEISESDFAQVFASGPIQVPQVKTKSSKISKFNIKWFAGAAAASFVIAVLGGASWKLWSEEGLLGYRMDGASLVKAYRPPSEVDLAAFQAVFAQVPQLLIQDDPAGYLKSVSELEGIFTRDERNLEAAAWVVELHGRLSAWQGFGSPSSTAFDQGLKRFDEIKQKSKRESSTTLDAIVSRARAWRSLGVGEYVTSRERLETEVKDPDSLTVELVAELYYRSGDEKKALEKFSSIKGSLTRRGEFFLALIKNDQEKMRQLGQQDYLPASIELAISSMKAANASEPTDQIAVLEKLADKAKEYPWPRIRLQMALADRYQAAGNNDKARDLWNSVLKVQPSHQQALLNLSESFEKEGRWDDAILKYREALRSGSVDRALHLRLIRLLRERVKVVEALEETDKAIKLFPKDPRFYFEKGLIQMIVNQDEPARTSFATALERDPEFELATISLAELSARQKDWKEAEKLYAKIKPESEHYPKALFGLGQLALLQHRIDDAQKFFARSVKENPKNDMAFDSLVRLLLRKELDDQASAIADKGVSENPDSPYAKLAKARVQAFRGEGDAAVETLKSALAFGEMMVGFQLGRIEVLIESHKYAEARSVLDALSKREISDPDILYLKARLTVDDLDGGAKVMGGQEAALRSMQLALRSDPENERYLVMKARILVEMDDRQEAIETTDRILLLYPDNPMAYQLRGRILMVNGQNKEALESFETALKLTRFQADIYSSIASLHRALGNPIKAIQFYQKILKEHPNDASAHLELGKLYNEAGRYLSALQSLQTAIRLDPQRAEPYYYLGFIQKELGDRVSALRSFEKFLSRNPQSLESATVRDEIDFLKRQPSEN